MKEYTVRKISTTPCADDWENAPKAEITCSPWKDYASPYYTYAQLLYTDEAIFVHFRTDEKPLLAKKTKHNGNICADSCMELFIMPSEKDGVYFNFEINPTAVSYIGKCTDRYHVEFPDEDRSIFDITSVIKGDKWELFYKIPFSFIRKYTSGISGEMRANFYKCGEETKKEHYACWNEIELDSPDYHCPQFFGRLIFK